MLHENKETFDADQFLSKMTDKLNHLIQDYQSFLSDNGLTEQDLSVFFENQENFSSETWKQMQEQKKQIEEKASLSLQRAKDPVKAKQAFQSLGSVQSHWIPMR